MKKIIVNFKYGLIILIFLILFSGSVFADNNNFENKNKVSNEVFKHLEKQENASIIVELKGKETIFNKINLDNKVSHFKDKSLRIYKVNENQLNGLMNNPNVKSISLSHSIKSHLQDSTILVNATQVWDEQIGNVNITGIDETVCIIDSGVNFSHPDLIGRNKSCNIDCFNKDCIENCSDSDNYGHGTHVAGIVGASGGIEGVAPGVGLISVRVLDEHGGGSVSAELDLVNAIDWCVENKDLYNISVITMSLGTDAPFIYDEHCDSTFSGTWTKAINNATFYNISVPISSGNEDNLTHISAPACIENATAVGATTKENKVAGYSNRGNLIDFFAPGGNFTEQINSTYFFDENYLEDYGTSMACPHVAGAFALLSHYYMEVENKEAKVSDLVDALNTSGQVVSDSGIDYKRIDILGALNDLDTPGMNPNVTTNTPANTTYASNSIDFNVTMTSAIDLGLGGCWISIDSGVTNLTLLNTTNNDDYNATNTTVPDGDYQALIWCNDSSNRINDSEIKDFQVDTIYPEINITYPINNTNHTINITINYTRSDTNLDACWYSNDTYAVNTTLASCVNITSVNWTEGYHNVSIWVNDSANNINSSFVAFTID